MFKLKSTILCCALAVLVASLSSLATVAPTELWGDLALGEYAIGFETVEMFDHSRTYVDRYDYDGNLRSVETSMGKVGARMDSISKKAAKIGGSTQNGSDVPTVAMKSSIAPSSAPDRRWYSTRNLRW